MTTDTADDTARVAMFGVKIETDGSLFSENYKQVEPNNAGNTPDADTSTGETAKTGITVHSAGKLGSGGKDGKGISNLVAPGTKNTDGMVFSVTGTPEVSVKVEIKIDDDTASDIYLGQASLYPNMTTGEVYDSSTEDWDQQRYERVTYMNGTVYYPIQYTLEHTTTATGAGLPDWTSATVEVEKKPLSQVVAYLDTLSASTTYPAGTDLTKAFGWYRLTWEWAFEGQQTLNGSQVEATLVDKNDTLLGDLAAQKYGTNMNLVNEALTALKAASTGSGQAEAIGNIAFVDQTGNATQASGYYAYNLEAKLDFTITVTQVD